MVVDHEDDGDGGGEERRRSPTPHLATKSYRPDGSKEVKGPRPKTMILKKDLTPLSLPGKSMPK